MVCYTHNYAIEVLQMTFIYKGLQSRLNTDSTAANPQAHQGGCTIEDVW